LEEMEQTGTFTRRSLSTEGALSDVVDPEVRKRIAALQMAPDRFLAWLAATLAGSVLIAGEMGSGVRLESCSYECLPQTVTAVCP